MNNLCCVTFLWYTQPAITDLLKNVSSVIIFMDHSLQKLKYSNRLNMYRKFRNFDIGLQSNEFPPFEKLIGGDNLCHNFLLGCKQRKNSELKDWKKYVSFVLRSTECQLNCS